MVNKEKPEIKVAGAIILQEGQILLTQRKLNTSHGGLWEFPGGKVEREESFQDCLKRELIEELQISVEVNSFYGKVVHDYESFIIHLWTYLCTIIEGSIVLKDHQAFTWISPHSILDYSLTPADIPIAKKLHQSFL